MRSLAETVLLLTSQPRPRAQDSTTAPGPVSSHPEMFPCCFLGTGFGLATLGLRPCPPGGGGARTVDWAFGVRDTAVWVP